MIILGLSGVAAYIGSFFIDGGWFLLPIAWVALVVGAITNQTVPNRRESLMTAAVAIFLLCLLRALFMS